MVKVFGYSTTRTFNGVKYDLAGGFPRKSDADIVIRGLKERNYKYKTITAKGMYIVYKRK